MGSWMLYSTLQTVMHIHVIYLLLFQMQYLMNMHLINLCHVFSDPDIMFYKSFCNYYHEYIFDK